MSGKNLPQVFTVSSFKINVMLSISKPLVKASLNMNHLSTHRLSISFLLKSLPFLITISTLGAWGTVYAQSQSMPARENFRTLQQPNGESIVVVSRGDAVFHWLETRSGYIVIKNNDSGYYEYALLNDQQGLLSFIASGIAVESGQPPALNDSSIDLAKSSAAAKIRIQKLKQR